MQIRCHGDQAINTKAHKSVRWEMGPTCEVCEFSHASCRVPLEKEQTDLTTDAIDGHKPQQNKLQQIFLGTATQLNQKISFFLFNQITNIPELIRLLCTDFTVKPLTLSLTIQWLNVKKNPSCEDSRFVPRCFYTERLEVQQGCLQPMTSQPSVLIS